MKVKHGEASCTLSMRLEAAAALRVGQAVTAVTRQALRDVRTVTDRTHASCSRAVGTLQVGEAEAEVAHRIIANRAGVRRKLAIDDPGSRMRCCSAANHAFAFLAAQVSGLFDRTENLSAPDGL